MKKNAASIYDENDKQEAPPTIPVFSFRGALSPLLVAPIVVLFFITVFSPLMVLDMFPWALKFTDLVQRLMPGVNMKAHANSTIYPQVALLANSLTVALVLPLSLVWLWQSMENYHQLLARRQALGRLSIKMHLGLLLVGPTFCLAIIYFLVGIPGDPSFAKGATTHSRFGLAFLSATVLYSTSLILGVQVLCVRLFFDTYIRKDN